MGGTCLFRSGLLLSSLLTFNHFATTQSGNPKSLYVCCKNINEASSGITLVMPNFSHAVWNAFWWYRFWNSTSLIPKPFKYVVENKICSCAEELFSFMMMRLCFVFGVCLLCGSAFCMQLWNNQTSDAISPHLQSLLLYLRPSSLRRNAGAPHFDGCISQCCAFPCQQSPSALRLFSQFATQTLYIKLLSQATHAGWRLFLEIQYKVSHPLFEVFVHVKHRTFHCVSAE